MRTLENHADAVARVSENTGRPILLPDADSFGDVLEYIGPFEQGRDDLARYIPEEVPQASDWERSVWHYCPGDAHYGRNQIGPYCTVNMAQLGGARHGSAAVRATDAVIDAVSPRIVTPDDNLSFQLIGHERSGRVLVILKHGYIIGGHYLAYIDPATIPPAMMATL
jgi:hypothetical protein